jgi:hypothetical protein
MRFHAVAELSIQNKATSVWSFDRADLVTDAVAAQAPDLFDVACVPAAASLSSRRLQAIARGLPGSNCVGRAQHEGFDPAPAGRERDGRRSRA